jgi:hypothetical protein
MLAISTISSAGTDVELQLTNAPQISPSGCSLVEGTYLVGISGYQVKNDTAPPFRVHWIIQDRVFYPKLELISPLLDPANSAARVGGLHIFQSGGVNAGYCIGSNIYRFTTGKWPGNAAPPLLENWPSLYCPQDSYVPKAVGDLVCDSAVKDHALLLNLSTLVDAQGKQLRDLTSLVEKLNKQTAERH